MTTRRGRRSKVTLQTELMAYMAICIFTFFIGSFLVARCTHASPTEPTNFGLLVGASFIWPIALPLAVAVFLFFIIAWLAEELASK